MYWAKRDFAHAEFAPYQTRLGELQLANATRYAEFIMVSVDKKPSLSTYYVGVPDRILLASFNEFEGVEESDLPKEVDTILAADATSKPFTSRFRLKKRW